MKERNDTASIIFSVVLPGPAAKYKIITQSLNINYNCLDGGLGYYWLAPIYKLTNFY